MGGGLLLEERIDRIWLLILVSRFLLSFLCTLMRTLGTVHVIYWAFMMPVTVLQGYLAGSGPWRRVWDLSLEPGHLIPSESVLQISLFPQAIKVVYLYFTTVAVFANVNKNKSITCPSENAMKSFERLCCYLGTDRAPSGPIPLKTGQLWI